MAQIIHLPPKQSRNCGTDTVFEVMLSARLRETVSQVKSSGEEVFLWVRKLEAKLEDLDVIANALTGPSQTQLLEEVQLLRGKLSLAVDELKLTLHNVPERFLSLRLGLVEDLIKSTAGNGGVEANFPPGHGMSHDAEMLFIRQYRRDVPTASRI